MEVRIGIIHSPREISFDTNSKPEEIRASLEEAFTKGTQPLVSFTDAKGQEYLVPLASIAYVEIGSDTNRKIGFVN